MKTPVLSLLLVSFGLTLAKPSILDLSGLAYASVGSEAPVGADGRVHDTPEVALAKFQHAAAQLNERRNLANEAARSGNIEVSRLLVSQNDLALARALGASQDLASLTRAASPLTLASIVSDTPGSAPVGSDGRVVDTPAVARAKVEHAVAHINEKLLLSNEAAKNSGFVRIDSPSPVALHF